MYYSAKATNDIVEAQVEDQYQQVLATVTDRLLTIASFVDEEDWFIEPMDQYKTSLNRIVSVCPNLVEPLTAQRVTAAWKLTNLSFINLFSSIKDYILPEDSQPASQSCEIFPECDCDRDNCESCNFWNQY